MDFKLAKSAFRFYNALLIKMIDFQYFFTRHFVPGIGIFK